MFTKKDLTMFFRYCLSLTGDAHLADDLLQCCFEKYVKLDTSKVQNAKAYFRRIIRNQFIDDQRKKGNQLKYELDENAAVIQLDLKSLDDIIVEREMVATILHSLAPLEREILFLWAVEGFSLQEISNDLGIPKGTLLSRLHRLKIKIRKKFDVKKVIGGAL